MREDQIRMTILAEKAREMRSRLRWLRDGSPTPSKKQKQINAIKNVTSPPRINSQESTPETFNPLDHRSYK